MFNFPCDSSTNQSTPVSPTKMQPPGLRRALENRTNMSQTRSTSPCASLPSKRPETSANEMTQQPAYSATPADQAAATVGDDLISPCSLSDDYYRLIPDIPENEVNELNKIWVEIRRGVRATMEDKIHETKKNNFWKNFAENNLKPRGILIHRDSLDHRKPHEHFKQTAPSEFKGGRELLRDLPAHYSIPISANRLWATASEQEMDDILCDYRAAVEKNRNEDKFADLAKQYFLKTRREYEMPDRCRYVIQMGQQPLSRYQSKRASSTCSVPPVVSPQLPATPSLSISSSTNNMDFEYAQHAAFDGDVHLNPNALGIQLAEKNFSETLGKQSKGWKWEASIDEDDQWNIIPDMVYQLSLRGFNQNYRSKVFEGIAYAGDLTDLHDTPTIGYFSIEFKRDLKLQEAARCKAECQIAAASILWLSWSFRMRVRALELCTDHIMSWEERESHFEHVRQYGITLRGDEWDVWVTKPRFKSTNAAQPVSLEWAGCDVRKLQAGQLNTAEDVRRLAAWINEIHWWGLSEFFDIFEDDCKTLALKSPPTAMTVAQDYNMSARHASRNLSKQPLFPSSSTLVPTNSPSPLSSKSATSASHKTKDIDTKTSINIVHGQHDSSLAADNLPRSQGNLHADSLKLEPTQLVRDVDSIGIASALEDMDLNDISPLIGSRPANSTVHRSQRIMALNERSLSREKSSK